MSSSIGIGIGIIPIPGILFVKIPGIGIIPIPIPVSVWVEVRGVVAVWSRYLVSVFLWMFKQYRYHITGIGIGMNLLSNINIVIAGTLILTQSCRHNSGHQQKRLTH